MNFTEARSFINKKLDVSLSLFDAFYSDVTPYTKEVGGLYSYYKERNDTRRLRLFVVWKFGKMRVSKSLNNNDENDRLKKVN